MSNGFSNTAQRTNYSQNYRIWVEILRESSILYVCWSFLHLILSSWIDEIKNSWEYKNWWKYKMQKYGLNIQNQAMIFLRYSSLALLTSALVSIFLVARTLIFSAPLVFLIFLLSYFSAFLFGFLLGRMANCLNLKFGSYLTKYCWLS